LGLKKKKRKIVLTKGKLSKSPHVTTGTEAEKGALSSSFFLLLDGLVASFSLQVRFLRNLFYHGVALTGKDFQDSFLKDY